MLKIEELKEMSIVLTGFQFIEQNPLGFFEFNDILDKDKAFEDKVLNFEAEGKLIVKEDGFKPVKDVNGDNKANKDIFVVSRAKSRPVLIFQDIELCKEYHDNVFIIPIQTLRKPIEVNYVDKNKYSEKLVYYNNVVKRSDEVLNHYYIPKIVEGQLWERILVLNDARFVHISTLYGQAEENAVNDKDLKEIAVRLAKMLKIETKEECEECEYFFGFENMRKIVSRVERLTQKYA